MLLKCVEGQNLTSAEKIAINYINEHVDVIADMTISDIAEKAFISTATISRAIRKCGLNNMLDVRYRLVEKELGQKSVVVSDILQNSYIECIRTIEKINPEAILKLVEYIKVAKKIHILARGVTRLTAQEFEFQLQCQKYNVYAQWDSEVMKRIDELIGPEDLVIIFSISNSTPELKVAARLAKQVGATVAICCCVEGTELEAYADIKLIGESVPIIPKKALGCRSRIPLQIIGRTVIEYLAMD